MQTVGVLLLAVGVWIVYAGFNGLDALKTAAAVLADPANASKVIADAKAASIEDLKKKSASGSNPIIDTIKGIADSIAGWSSMTMWLSQFKITDGWQSHLDRGSSQGGLDFAMPAGTPLPSPLSGVVTYEPGEGSGGNIITVTGASGWKSQYLHVRSATVTSGTKVKAGQIIGKSGGVPGEPGAGSSTGPHLHWHLINPQGKRINPQTVFQGNDDGAGKYL